MSSYVVNWHRSDGQPGWHPVADVQEAARFVEHLRNAEGVEVTLIYALEEVAFEFRPYFKVELATAAAPPSYEAHIVAEPEPEPEPVAVPVFDVVAGSELESEAEPDMVAASAPAWSTVAEAAPELDTANGSSRRGLFGR